MHTVDLLRVAREEPLEHAGHTADPVQAGGRAAHELCIHTGGAASTVRARPVSLVHRHATARPLRQEVDPTLCILTHLQPQPCSLNPCSDKPTVCLIYHLSRHVARKCCSY